MTQPSIPNFTRKVDWALCLAHAGFTVIPVQADTKTPVTKWAIWESDQSDDHIQKHWVEFHPVSNLPTKYWHT